MVQQCFVGVWRWNADLGQRRPPSVRFCTGMTLSESPTWAEPNKHIDTIIPAACCSRPPLLQLCDIKLYLRSQDTLIAKTQIPITAVPFSSNVGAGDDDDDDGSSSPRSPRSPPSGGVFSTSSPPSSARAFAPDLLPKLPDSSHRDLAALATASAPSTPRGVSEYLRAHRSVYGGCLIKDKL